MKKILLSIVAIATLSLNSFGQAPEGFKYQAVVRDAGNTILNNQAVGMRMTIQQGSIGGTTVYQETFAPTTNAYGLVNLEIGSGTVVSGTFATIDWTAGPYFMETAVDVTGGTSYAVMGTSQLMSVPYALHAKTAESSIIDNVDDADNDPANEHNTSAQINGNDLEVTDGGGTVAADISSLATDVEVGAAIAASAALDLDTDPANELQDWTTLPGIPADFADDVDDVDDADANATNELQNIEQVLVVGNDANGNNIVNTGKIGIGTVTPNIESSMDIATALPVIFPSMTQTEVNGIVTPVEGMVQFNTDARKLQVYAMITDNASIMNEIFVGNESGPFSFILDQSFTSPIDGQVIAVELFMKDALGGAFPDIDFMGQGIYTVPNYTSWTWHTFVLNNPIPVTNGGNFMLSFIGPGVDERTFGVNSNYPNGSGCCFGDDDLMFRVHIQPNPGAFGWQNMH